MAVSLNVAEKNLEDLEKEVTCAVCQELYTDPKILPCLHYYCKRCILKIVLREGEDKPFSCPECRKNTILPEGGIEALKSAFFTNRLKSIYEKHKKALSKKVQCEICTEPEALANSFCRQCEKFACQNCVHLHSVMKAIFVDHEIVSIDQLNQVKVEEFVPRSPAPPKCKVHNKSLKIFCFDCNKLICRDCTVKDHKNHNIEFNNVAADNKKNELMECLKPLKEVKNSLSQALNKLQNLESMVKAQGVSVASAIDVSFEELHSILDTRKNKLLEDAKVMVGKKIANIKEQEKNLSFVNADISSVIEYTEQCVRHCSDDEVMSMHIEISRHIKSKAEELDLQSTLEVMDEAEISVEVVHAEALERLCEEAKITSSLDYVVVDKIPNAIELDKEMKVEIVNTMKKPTKLFLNSECTIKCLPTGSVSKLKVKETISGRYEINYTPTVCGRYEFSVSAYGQPIKGNPFTVTVYPSLTQLSNPIKIWEGVSYPYVITVNSKEEIVVAKFCQDVEIFDKNGTSLRSVKYSEHQIEKLRSVAIDDQDNMYFIGERTNKLGKSNRNCDEIKVHAMEQVNGPGYWSIAVVDDEVMVTEWNNEGQIMVYDKDLKYLRQISCGKKVKFRCLHPDHHSNLYISSANSTIEVINKKGQLVRSLSHDDSGVPRIRFPYMVYVYDQYVYIADDGLAKTVVFTTDGNYITTFGFCGGICIDQDGILYVGDIRGHKIACY